MKRAIGIGGIFFKSKDPEKLRAWYQKHLGLEPDAYGSVVFDCRDNEASEKAAQTVWSLFPSDTKYFAPSTAAFMINYRVENLDELLHLLRSEEVEVDDYPIGLDHVDLPPGTSRFESADFADFTDNNRI